MTSLSPKLPQATSIWKRHFNGRVQDLEKIQKCQHKPSPHSIMLRGFQLQSKFCRVSGCLFLPGLFTKPLETVTVTWKSWYSFYSASCFFFFVWYESNLITRYVLKIDGSDHLFSQSLVVLMHVVVVLKSVVNYISMITGSRSILDFLRESALFEGTIGFPSCKCCIPKEYFLADVKRILLFVVFFLVYCVGTHFQLNDVFGSEKPWSAQYVIYRVCGILTGILFFTYDSLHFVSVKVCSKVLGEYIKTQLKVIETCVSHSPGGSMEQAAKHVEEVRMRLCIIRNLKTTLNDVWNRSIVTSCACQILVLCIAIFTVCTGGLARRDLWMALIYSLYTVYETVDLANVSQSMANNIQYLHNSINPQDFTVVGGDFFSIDMPLLVSITGSVITYSVILVQTSQEFDTNTNVEGANGTRPGS
ncbi:hypothetical protein ISCGN_020477 [Ixodes scapularis]